PIARAVPLLDAGDSRRDEVSEQLAWLEWTPERKAHRHLGVAAGVTRFPPLAGNGNSAREPFPCEVAVSLAKWGGPGCAHPQLSRRRTVDGADGLVEGADAAEPGGPRDPGERQVGAFDEGARGLGTLRPGQAERAGPHLLTHEPLHVPWAVSQRGRQRRDIGAVEQTVLDEAHGPRHHVGADVPLRGAGRRVRQAAL